jgi:hypothetical protein
LFLARLFQLIRPSFDMTDIFVNSHPHRGWPLENPVIREKGRVSKATSVPLGLFFHAKGDDSS